jgi:hypothetical protein
VACAGTTTGAWGDITLSITREMSKPRNQAVDPSGFTIWTNNLFLIIASD